MKIICVAANYANPYVSRYAPTLDCTAPQTLACASAPHLSQAGDADSAPDAAGITLSAPQSVAGPGQPSLTIDTTVPASVDAVSRDHPASGHDGQTAGQTLASQTARPTLYLKPETALTRPDWPFFVPDWSHEVDAAVGLVVRVNRLGKSIAERFAHRYYDEVTLGVDFTARDVLRSLQASGRPWEVAKGFDGAAYCGQRWLRVADLSRGIQDLHFTVGLNGQTWQEAWTGDMLHTVDRLVAYASRYYLLKTGDLIFTGAPSPARVVTEGDVIEGWVGDEHVLTCRCK